MPTQPTLGYGKPTEASIDQVNIWMRSQPWYQQIRGTAPKLNDSQRRQILRAAQAQGVVVDEGHMEVDPSGNFNPKGHKLRNTLIVAGIAGATIATMGAAGVFSGAAAGGGAAAGSGGAAAAGAGTAAAAGGVGAGTIGAGTAAVGAGLSYADLLKYGLPVAGNLVGGLIQAKASSSADEAQRKYLEEALAYEKEKDQYQRGIDAAAVTREENRYAGYQGRIAPFIANGTSSNDRMAALLGLPARAPSAGGGSSGGGRDMGDPIAWADKLSPADKLKVDALLKASNSNDNPNYWYGVNAQHGGFDATGADWNQRRISTGDGVGKGYAGATTPAPTAPATSATPATAASMVTLRAPDGSTRQVPAGQADHYISRGATVLQGAA